MGLRVWLPLNDTLENKGLDNVTVTNSGAVVDINGKTGSCYSKGSADYISVTGMTTPLQYLWSACCWFNRSSECEQTGSAHIICMNGSNTSNFTFAIMDYNGKLGAYFASTSSANRKISDFTIERDTWYHVCLTYDGFSGRLYVNGNLELLISNPATPIANNKFMIGGRFGLGGDIIMKVNDVRIYDHCLSSAEVHKISQGLIKHYKFSSYNLINKNTLTSGCYINSTGGTKTTSNWYATDYIPVYYGNKYQTFDLSHGGSGTYIALYNYNKTFKRSILLVANENLTIVPNADESYIRLSVRNYDNELSIAKFLEVQSAFYDSSGYDRNATIVGDNISLSVDANRYGTSVTGGSPSYAIMDTMFSGSKLTPELTWCGWIKRINEDGAARYICSDVFTVYMSSDYTIRTGWNHATTSSTANNSWNTGRVIPLNTWTHVAFTFKDGVMTLYLNGAYSKTSDRSDTGQFLGGYKGRIILSSASYTYHFDGNLSDVRVYCTALSAEDINAIYRTEAKIDKNSNVYSYEFLEDTKESITNNGQMVGHNIFEICPTLHYDKTIYVEPDGSKWAHIFHHNAPTENGLFSSTDTFEKGVYINENKWYDIEQFIGHMSAYEFMVKQKRANTSTEEKYRWVQTANPLTAAYADVSPSSGNITFNTSSEYESSNYGGLFYGVGSNTRMRIANATSSNWYGAMGAVIYSSDSLPGYPKTMITTGYLDLYARIDNLPDLCAKVIKNQGIYGVQIIEM